jgi:thioesterase domain-containing protein/acyl carrier protein
MAHPFLAAPPEFSKADTRRSAADIRAWIVGELASALKVDRRSIDSSAPLSSLGADSLIAMGITGALAEWLNCDVSATLMWDYPSIDAIAEALAGNDAPAIAGGLGVIELQPLGHLTPLFCFPGAGGHPVTFAPLAAHLAPKHPCYGLSVPGLNGEQIPLESVEEIAAVMLKHIRSRQGKGPYQLAGYSYGGLLAFEAAQQLTAAGESVSLLAMFDTSTPEPLPPPRWQRLARHAYNLAMRPGRREYLRERLASWRRARQAIKEVEWANYRAGARYQPRPYQGSVLFLRATDRPSDHVTHDIRWGALTGGRVHCIDIPGHHLSVLSVENAAAAAQKLLPYLSEQFAF